MTDKSPGAGARFDERLKGYADISAARAWLDRNWTRIRELFLNVRLRDFVFEPIRGVFALEGSDEKHAIRQCITMVAVANAVMAGLPDMRRLSFLASSKERYMIPCMAKPGTNWD